MSDFWARRKAAVAAEVEAEAREDAAVVAAEAEARNAEKTDEELLAEHNLPDPDSLNEGDDFKPFLAEAIPARLKTRALRRLWRVNPILANVDGLVDYGLDYTDAATVVDNLQTAYQVGKGMLSHIEEMARREMAAEEMAEAEAAEPEPDVEPEIEEPEEAVEVAPVLAAAVEPAPEPEPAYIAPTRRRMQFTFDAEDA